MESRILQRFSPKNPDGLGVVSGQPHGRIHRHETGLSKA